MESLTITLLSLLIYLSSSSTTAAKEIWNHCETDGDYLARDVNVQVEGCDTSPCDVYRGTNHTIIITFVPKVDTNGLYLKIYGKIGLMVIPSGPTMNVCNKVPTCTDKPGLNANTTYVLKFPYVILKQYPKIHVSARLRLLTTQEQTLVCTEVPLVIKDLNEVVPKNQNLSYSTSVDSTTTILPITEPIIKIYKADVSPTGINKIDNIDKDEDINKDEKSKIEDEEDEKESSTLAINFIGEAPKLIKEQTSAAIGYKSNLPCLWCLLVTIYLWNKGL